MFVWILSSRTWQQALICAWIITTELGAPAQSTATTATELSSGACIYATPETLTAEICTSSVNPPQLLFRFRRTATQIGSTTDVLREYTYPDGKLATTERVLYEGNKLKLYELKQEQVGSSGVASIGPDPTDPRRSLIFFEFNQRGESHGRSRPTTEVLTPDTLVNDMMGAFLSTQYNRLQRGAKVSCRCLVVSRKETIGFSLVKQSDTVWRGHEAILVKMQPASFLISALVNPLVFTIEKAAPHRVLQYTGRTTPRIKEYGRWKDLDAVTVFDW